MERTFPYVGQLNHVLRLLKKEVSNEEIVNVLGNDVTALYSVPTAIFCFLRSQNPIKHIEVICLKLKNVLT